VNWFDIVLILLVALSVVTGFRTGFTRAGIGFIAAIVGIYFGFWSYGIVAARVRDHVSSLQIANLIGFLVIFVGVVILGSIVGLILAKLFKWVGLSWFDRLLGGVFGVVRGSIIVAALVTVALAFWPPPLPETVKESRFLPYVIDISDVLAATTPHELKDAFHDAKEKVQKAWQKRRPELAPGDARRE